jgi:hypothetical protein
LHFLSSFNIFNLIKFAFWFAADAKEEFKTQAGIDEWKPWNYGRSRFIPYGQKKGGNGSSGLGSGGNGGEGVTQGGDEANEGKEGWQYLRDLRDCRGGINSKTGGRGRPRWKLSQL